MEDIWSDFKRNLRVRISFVRAIYPTIYMGDKTIFEVLSDQPNTFSSSYSWKSMPYAVRSLVENGMKDEESGKHYWN